MEVYSWIGRRDFFKAGAAAGLGLVLPLWMVRRAGAAVRVGDVPEPTILTDLQGRQLIVPSDFMGKVVLLHFWASWCPTCRGEMTALESAYVKYRKRGAVVCSIDLGEKREAVVAYIRNMNISYPVLLDPNSSTRRLFGVSGVPTYFVLTRKGAVRYKIIGAADKDGLDQMIRTLL